MQNILDSTKIFQQYRIDYDQTYTTIMKLMAFNVFFTIVTHYNFNIN